MSMQLCMRAGGKCAVSAWGDWSACSVTCGVGQRVRKRRYHNPMVDETMCGHPVMETENCIGILLLPAVQRIAATCRPICNRHSVSVCLCVCVRWDLHRAY